MERYCHCTGAASGISPYCQKCGGKFRFDCNGNDLRNKPHRDTAEMVVSFTVLGLVFPPVGVVLLVLLVISVVVSGIKILAHLISNLIQPDPQ